MGDGPRAEKRQLTKWGQILLLNRAKLVNRTDRCIAKGMERAVDFDKVLHARLVLKVCSHGIQGDLVKLNQN